jgi:hypothetical protein
VYNIYPSIISYDLTSLLTCGEARGSGEGGGAVGHDARIYGSPSYQRLDQVEGTSGQANQFIRHPSWVADDPTGQEVYCLFVPFSQELVGNLVFA